MVTVVGGMGVFDFQPSHSLPVLCIRTLFPTCCVAVCRYTFNDNANLTNSTYINLKERDG